MTHARTPHDEGLGLVEVIVAIFILGLLAVAILPMIWTGLQVATQQSTVATATQHVARVIEDARGQANAGCDALPVARTVEDGRGVTLALAGVVVGGCTGVTGGVAVKYTATATGDDGKVLSSATTRIFLPAPPEAD